MLPSLANHAHGVWVFRFYGEQVVRGSYGELVALAWLTAGGLSKSRHQSEETLYLTPLTAPTHSNSLNPKTTQTLDPLTPETQQPDSPTTLKNP